jgi:hypothetical protein
VAGTWKILVNIRIQLRVENILCEVKLLLTSQDEVSHPVAT